MKKILVVDDDRLYREPLVDALKLEFPNEEFLGVPNFLMAGVLLDERAGKVMLLDLCLEGSGGADKGHALLAIARDYNVPVIVISGREEELVVAKETHEAVACVLKEATLESFEKIVTFLKAILVALNGHD